MKRLAAAALVLAVVAGIPARAASFTTAFDDLRTELVLRKDNQFEAKQQKAILKSLALIDKTSKDLTGDLKKAVAVAKALEAGFPEEFLVPKTFTPTNLLLLFGVDVLPLLRNENVQPGLDNLNASILSLVPGSPAGPKAQAAADAAAAFLAAPADTVDGSAKLLLKAWKKVLLGRKLFLKGVYQRMDLVIQGTTYAANQIRCDVFAVDHGLMVFGYVNQATLPGSSLSGPAALQVKVIGVTGTGSYPIGAAAGDGAIVGPFISGSIFAPWVMDPGTGTLVVTHYDPEGGWIAGKFHFSATGGLGPPFPATLEVSGTFTASQDIMLDPGSTPQ